MQHNNILKRKIFILTIFIHHHNKEHVTLENAVPNQQYWCVKDLKEWGLDYLKESIELLRAIKQPRYLYGDAVVPFGGESRSEVEHRVYRALYEMMDTTDGERQF